MSARILIVDDDNKLRLLFRLVLQQHEFDVSVAENGKEATQILLRDGFDYQAIVLDMMMPVMDGPHFLQWLREEQQQSIPVMMLTAAESAVTKQELQRFGANEVLYKPVNTLLLLEKVQELTTSADA